jgi:hypothetical protein
MRTYKQLIAILTEDVVSDRLNKLKKDNKGKISTDHDTFAVHKDSDAIIDHFAEADPHPKKQHTNWIINQYKQGNLRQEDRPMVNQSLSNFEKYKSKLAVRDLNNYANLSELDSALEPHIGSVSNRQRDITEKIEGADKIFEKNGITVHHLKTKKAACLYGKNTKWCTASTNEDGTPSNDNMFDRYNASGPLYFVRARDENGKIAKYQFQHENGGQYQDEKNHPIDVNEFLKRNPELRNVSQWQGKHPAFTSDENFDKHFDSLILSHTEETIADKRLKSHHIDKLVNDNSSVRKAIVDHPNLQQHHIDKLVDDNDPDVRKAIARQHPKLQQHHIDKLVNDVSLYVRKAIANHPNLQPHHIDKLVGDEYGIVKKVIAEHPKLQQHHIDKLVDAASPGVKEAIAEHPKLQQHHIDKLVDDDSSLVKAAITKHPKLQQHHIDKLVGAEYGNVKEAIAKHQNLQQHHIDKLVEDKDIYVRKAIAKHPKLQQHHIDKLVEDENPAVKIAIAKRSDLQQHHIDKLVDDKDKYVKIVIAAHPNLQQHHVDKLVNDGDPYVREAIAKHPLYKKLYPD